MVRVTVLDVPYWVVTATGPVQLLVGTCKEIDVLLHEFVGTDTPFSVTVPVELRKFCPVIVICDPGAAGEVILVMLGNGTATVTVAEADLVVSAWLAAVIITLSCLVMLAGAVYRPEELIVPLPDGVMDQVTAVLLVFATVAVNCWVCPG